ncbi:MAG: hypothetical protein JWM54_351 [Acidobacteriaceae bacterium]|jgi:hypothetical protein|nr:hypothetical protein [Acidobacteriaceae bacterium]
MVFAFGENWSAMGVLRFVVIRRPLVLADYLEVTRPEQRVRLEARKRGRLLLVLQHTVIANFV